MDPNEKDSRLDPVLERELAAWESSTFPETPPPVESVDRVVVLEGMPTRLVTGGGWSWVEEWRDGAWVKSPISVGEVLKSLPASESKLEAAGVAGPFPGDRD